MKIRSQPVNAILDSGAAVCVITKTLADKLHLDITQASNTIIVTADGTRKRALGQIPKVSVMVQDILILTTFHVIDSRDDTLLLGIN